MNPTQNEYSALQTEDCAHETVGTSLCCAWKVAPGVVWVQVRTPALTKKLRQVSGYREVAWSVMGGYLRTFEFRKSLAWARKWIARHTAANEAFFDQESSQSERAHKKGSSDGSSTPKAHKSKEATILVIEQPEERMAA